MSVPKTALIAEDDHNLQRLFIKAFSSAGFTVEASPDGPTTISMLRSNSPHVLILDLGLPDLSGTDILYQIRRSPEHKDMNVIVVSGNHKATSSDISNLADLVLMKPVSIRDLVKLAERLVSVSTIIL